MGACRQPCWAVGGAPHSLAHTKKLISFFVRLICPSVRLQCKPNSCFCGIVGVCPAHRTLFVVLGVDGLKPMPATTLCLSLTPPPPAVSHAHDVQTECVALSRTQHKNRYNTQICISTSGPPSTSSCPSREAKNTTVGNRSDKNKSKNRERELHSAIFGAKGFEKTDFELFLRVPLARDRGRGTISRPPSSVFVPLLFSPDFGAGDSERRRPKHDPVQEQSESSELIKRLRSGPSSLEILKV